MDLTGVKIMWTNYPNMPTGANARRETYEKLVDFALRHNLVIVNDNPYSFILNHERLSILQVPGAKLYEQEPQHAGLACGHVGHERGIREMDS